MAPPGWLRPAALSFAFVLGAAALATTRATYEGEQRLREADAAIRRQDMLDATVRARAAAGWYVPGAPHVAAAYARLLHVARTSEANGDRDTALFAWRAMRSAAEQTAWLLQPHQRELDLAAVAIARLTSDAPRPMFARDTSDPQTERHIRSLLERRDTPRTSSIALVVAGLWAAVAGQLLLAVRAISPEGTLRWDRARAPAALGLGGLILYAASLWMA